MFSSFKSCLKQKPSSKVAEADKMTYKFYYFPVRGAGESIRMMFALAGEKYEDVRIGMEEWPKHKAEMPFGQMPVLEVDGEKIPQSGAIGRFVARKFGFAGKTPIEMAWVDAIIDQYKDYYVEMRDYFYTALGYMNKGDKDELYKTVYTPARDKFFSFLQTIYKKNGTGWLVGNSVTWADLIIADHILTITNLKPDAFDGFPELLELKKKVEAIPQIKAWIEKRPQTAN